MQTTWYFQGNLPFPLFISYVYMHVWIKRHFKGTVFCPSRDPSTRRTPTFLSLQLFSYFIWLLRNRTTILHGHLTKCKCVAFTLSWKGFLDPDIRKSKWFYLFITTQDIISDFAYPAIYEYIKKCLLLCLHFVRKTNKTKSKHMTKRRITWHTSSVYEDCVTTLWVM